MASPGENLGIAIADAVNEAATANPTDRYEMYRAFGKSIASFSLDVFGAGVVTENLLSNFYLELLPSGSPFPTSLIWWEDSSKVKKIIEESITYNTNKTINIDSWVIYDEDGITALQTVTDTYAYSGVFITSINRVVV